MISFDSIYRKYICTVAGIDKIDVLVDCLHLNESELKIQEFVDLIQTLNESVKWQMKEAMDELISCSYIRRGGAYELYPRIIETGKRQFFRKIMTQGLYPSNKEEEVNVWVFGPASLNVHMMGYLCDVVYPPRNDEQRYTSMIEEHADFVISLRRATDDLGADAAQKERERLNRLKLGEKGLKKDRTHVMRMFVYGINNSDNNSTAFHNGDTPNPNQDRRAWISSNDYRSKNRLDELYICAVTDDEVRFRKYWNEVLKKRNIRGFGGQLLVRYFEQGGEVSSAHAPPSTRILHALRSDPAYTNFRYFVDLVKVVATNGVTTRRFNVPSGSAPFMISREDALLKRAQRRIERVLGTEDTRTVREAVNSVQAGPSPIQPTAHPAVSSSQPAPHVTLLLNSVVMPDYEVCISINVYDVTHR